MSFKVGEKVVCVNDNWRTHDYRWNYPVINEIYTVEFVMPDDAITLEEINNSHIDKLLHADGVNTLASFYHWHFRKVAQIEQKDHNLRELENIQVVQDNGAYLYCGSNEIDLNTEPLSM